MGEVADYPAMSFLDTQVSLAPTHVSPLAGHTFEFPLPMNISVQQSSLMTPLPPKKKFDPPKQGGRQGGRHGDWSRVLVNWAQTCSTQTLPDLRVF